MRVVHLIDGAGWAGSYSTLALVSASVGRIAAVDQRVVLFGGHPMQHAARSVGMPEAAIRDASVPHQRIALSPGFFKKTLATLGRPDVLHCWTIGCATMAALRLPHVPRLLSITQLPDKRACHWLRMLVHESALTSGGRGAATTLLPISNTIRRALISSGVPEANVHVLRPAIDMGMVNNAARKPLRERWAKQHPELADAQRKSLILGLLSDPPHQADGYFAAIAASIANETRPDRDIYIVMHPDQQNRRRAESMLDCARNVKRIIREPRMAQPWQVLPACDAAIATGHAGSGLALLWAMAANVPILGDATYAVSEIVEDHHSALLYQPNEIRDLARRITELMDDTQLAWQLKDTARHECYSFFSRKTYCSNVQHVYEQAVADKPIDIPEMETTGGLRFAGRA